MAHLVVVLRLRAEDNVTTLGHGLPCRCTDLQGPHHLSDLGVEDSHVASVVLMYGSATVGDAANAYWLNTIQVRGSQVVLRVRLCFNLWCHV